MAENSERAIGENIFPEKDTKIYRWMMEVAWDGAGFFGWQRQPNKMTIQQCIEEALEKILGGEKVSVMAAGRTDAGVHARHQIISFACSTQRSEFTIYRGLNAILPKTIAIIKVSSVPLNFRVRNASSHKIYEYHFLPNSTKDPFLFAHTWMLRDSLDIVAMNQASQYFIGTHDVSSFRSRGCTSKSTIRSILTSEVFESDRRVVFSISGKGFLRHQVRIMAGTLLQVGLDQISVNDVKDILERKKRAFAGPTAPAKGLWLCRTFLHESWREKIENHQQINMT